MIRTRFFVAIAAASFSACAWLACAPAPTSMSPKADDAGRQGADDDAGSGGTGGFDDPGTLDAGMDPDSACASEGAEATLKREPVDVILVVDNVASMERQIESVQRHINSRFAEVLDEHKLDYRVIVISEHGDYKDPGLSHCPICIEAPLSGIPAGGCETPPDLPVDTAKFFHYSHRITKGWPICMMLEGFDKADALGRASNGWSEWLRKDAFKSIVVISPGRVQCSVDGVIYNDSNDPLKAEPMAKGFADKLQDLASEQFGANADERRFRFYTVGTLAPNDPPEAPYPPSAPLVLDTCEGGDVNTGLGYQALSRLTGGTRFPFCNPEAFGAIFESIAKDLVSGAPITCEFPIPEPPKGQKLDLDRVAVQYTPSDSKSPKLFGPVDNAEECVANAFYIEGETLHLCPESCALVQSDDAAKVSVLFDCQVIVR